MTEGRRIRRWYDEIGVQNWENFKDTNSFVPDPSLDDLGTFGIQDNSNYPHPRSGETDIDACIHMATFDAMTAIDDWD